MENNKDNKLIEVCDRCLRASCWYGEFMCDGSRFAGTTKKTISELKILDRENKSYWSNNKLIEVYGNFNPFGYNEN